MKIVLAPNRQSLGCQAAQEGAALLRSAIRTRGSAAIILATGASQFATLEALVAEPDIDWRRVTCFHLDEYVGMSPAHPASFQRFLRERFLERLPGPLPEFHFLRGETDPLAECRRVGEILARHAIDVAFVGIGENGHMAFNDPPANFETSEPYLVVQLDEACRRQQWGEGWFATLAEVPREAISMSIRQILKAGYLVCSVPDQRKAEAVKTTLEGPVSPLVPASILQTHPGVSLYLDPPSASLLSRPGGN